MGRTDWDGAHEANTFHMISPELRFQFLRFLCRTGSAAAGRQRSAQVVSNLWLLWCEGAATAVTDGSKDEIDGQRE